MIPIIELVRLRFMVDGKRCLVGGIPAYLRQHACMFVVDEDRESCLPLDTQSGITTGVIEELGAGESRVVFGTCLV